MFISHFRLKVKRKETNYFICLYRINNFIDKNREQHSSLENFWMSGKFKIFGRKKVEKNVSLYVAFSVLIVYIKSKLVLCENWADISWYNYIPKLHI
jgi:hypothetical protein